jgi:cellobiose phosphorylase
VEPYVIAADVYAVSQHSGRGGWTWYTGSAGWMYQLITESFLGLRREGNKLFFKPCLPPEWETVRINYRYKETNYSIQIIQEQNEIEEVNIVLDDVDQVNTSISLVDDGKLHEVRVICHVGVSEVVG